MEGIKMKCPKCQFDNPDDKKYCRECGAKLLLACPQCAAEILPSDKFCGECGHKLSLPVQALPNDLSFDEKLNKIQRYLPRGLTEKILSQKDRIEGERKQVTVMFCDMKGFTQLSERLGPEEAYTVMDQVYEILIHKVHDYEGTVNEFTGDGIMALFGAPIALEDAPQRAIRSAYAIHREMTKFSDKMKQEKQNIPALKMRIGIHTGPVVVGTLGNDLRVEFKAVGDTVNLASRVEGLAESGATYVTGETFKLTEGLFRFEALGDQQIKGKEAPINVYRVIAPSTRKTRFDVSAERGLTPFVGRDRELELLLDGFERVKEGRGQAFSIMAEAGIGKSRLLYEFRKAVANEDVTFLEGKSLSYSKSVPYHPVIDVLKSNFDVRENDSDSEIREKVQKGLKILGADEVSKLPYLLELFSVKDSGTDKIPMSSEEKKAQITEAVKGITVRGSEIRTLIIAYEDLHWVDKSSEEYLKSLLDGISGARILLIFTYRPEFVHTWGGRSFHSQLTLNRLSNRESLTMVADLLGTEDINRDLEKLILEKTEGVPFFIEEFVKSLKDLHVIEKKGNACGITKDIETVIIPSTIQDVIMARADILPEETKGVLQEGSVVGREFSHELIQIISGLQEQELLSHLSVLKNSELVYERGIYPQSTYIFKHAFTQAVVYETLLLKRRKILHGLVGKAIEELYQERIEEHVDLLYHHFHLSENWPKAVDYGRQAANRAYRLSQFHETITLLEQAQTCLLRLPEDRPRQETLIALRLEMNWPLQSLGDLGRALQNCQEAESIAQGLGSPVTLGKIFFQYGMTHFFMNQYQQSEMYYLHALEQFEGSSEDALTLMVKFPLAITYFSLAQWKKAAALYSENISIQEAGNSQAEYWENRYLPYTHSCTHLGYIRALQGRIEEAKELVQKGNALALEQVANLQSRVWCALWHSTFSTLVGEDFGALARAEGVLKTLDKTPSPILCFLGFAAKGNALMAVEQFEAARVVYEKALQAIEGTTHRRFLETVYYNLVKVALALGDWAGAERYYQAGLPLAQLNPEKDSPRFDFLKGRLLASSSPPNFGQAQVYFEQSIKADETSGAVVPAAQSRYYMAQMLARKGEVERAREMLTGLRSHFQSWSIPVWQQKCEQELETLASLE
jgi:class 3 adenylate cyclase/tetratricopeptide (TPR) repeat protein